MKAALGIMTTDLQPKIAMEECKLEIKKLKFMELPKDQE